MVRKRSFLFFLYLTVDRKWSHTSIEPILLQNETTYKLGEEINDYLSVKFLTQNDLLSEIIFQDTKIILLEEEKICRRPADISQN